MRRINIAEELQKIERFAMLVHGGGGAGKTHLMGSALQYESQFGDCAFVNVKGQDGFSSLAGYTFPSNVDLIELDNYDEIQRYVTDNTFRLLAVDSLRDVHRFSVNKTTLGKRLPKSGQNNNEYTQIIFDFESLLGDMKSSAHRFLTVCTSDRSTDQLTGKINITPDLTGRLAAGISSSFDFVGFLSASQNMGILRRSLSFQPMTVSISKDQDLSVVTRTRGLVRPVTEDIQIPRGLNAWDKILAVFEAHLKADSAEEIPEETGSKWI